MWSKFMADYRIKYLIIFVDMRPLPVLYLHCSGNIGQSGSRVHALMKNNSKETDRYEIA